MSVEIDPAELGFKRPFNREVSQTLHLRNPNPEPVAFKVKTTAPKHYCVRPNSGRIEPGKNVEVQVLLQAMKEEPPLDAKCKDKFLVQSVAVSGDLEFANVTSIFEKSAKSSIQERKIRVNFLSADSADGETNGVASEEEPPAYTSPTANNFETPATGLSRKTADDASPIPPPNFDRSEQANSPSNDSAFGSAAASVKATAASAASVIPTSSEDVKAQLAEANAQIQRLKNQVTDQGLRQRKVGAGEESTTPQLQQQHPQSVVSGVPVQVVAGLCLLSFLLAYFFF
ncbi:MSP domain protein [Paecilomyces variotii No. 5]|uniref:MSP domain protein n=1 Tax=Byssochlamys spectabilis (strain No. 5 / NBRC 109023) TaxID=1356009 RepID=V5HZQ3_BYSSN|nr:MSP domain protein [Paecilomyces variotii No. 5]